MSEIKADYKLTDDGMGVTIEALFRGMEGLVQSKTVVGEPVQVGETIIIPLIDVTCGMAAGAFVVDRISFCIAITPLFLVLFVCPLRSPLLLRARP